MTPFDDLSLLRSLLRIVESGSISAAARSLKMPQPSLSRHLRTLEERAGARLFQRDTHRLHLTEAGERLAASARALLELAEEAAEQLSREHAGLRGHLRVFSTIETGQGAVTRLLARFLRDHPGVSVELGYTNRPVQMIEEGYDVGIVAGTVDDERLIARSIASVARAVHCAPELAQRFSAPKKPSDLKAWPWAALSGRQFGGAADVVTFVSRVGALKTLRIAPVFVAEGATSLREFVREGLAISVLPDWLVAEDLASGRLVRLLPRWAARAIPLNMVYLADRRRPARVQAFLAFAEKALPDLISPR